MNKTPIYVIAGQSNANNSAMIAAVGARVKVEGGVLVYHAVNGTSLSPHLDVHGNGDWSPGPRESEGELLNELTAKIDSLVAGGRAELTGVIWIQGETDGRSENASRGYGERLVQLHDKLTSKFGAHQMVVSALSDDISTYRGDSAEIQESWDRVRDGQIRAGLERKSISVLQPDDFAKVKGYKTVEMFRSDLRHYRTEFSTDLAMALYDRSKLKIPDIDLNGGSAMDRLVYDGKNHAFINGAGGVDTLVFSTGLGKTSIYLTVSGAGKISSSSGTYDIGISSVEKISTFSSHDRIQLAGSVVNAGTSGGNDTVLGSARADNIWLGADDDLGYGHAGRDSIYGGDGNDTLFGGTDSDIVQGQNGDDHLDLGSGNDTGVGGIGRDRILGGSGNDLLDGGSGNDSLYGGDHDDVLGGGNGDDFLDGGSGDDILWGGQGNDVLHGGNGADRMSSGVGNDILRGGSAGDTLNGGVGNDTLHGGLGPDLLIGGAGADVFLLDSGHDLIMDFNIDEDTLVFLTGAEVEVQSIGRNSVVEWQLGDQYGTVTLVGFDTGAEMVNIDYW